MSISRSPSSMGVAVVPHQPSGRRQEVRMPLFASSSHPAVLRPRLLFTLSTLAVLPCVPIAAAIAEPAPTYQTEWSIVPIGGTTAVPVAAAVDAGGNVYVAQRNPQLLMSFTSTGVYRFAWELPGGNCPKQSASLDLDADGN